MSEWSEKCNAKCSACRLITCNNLYVNMNMNKYILYCGMNNVQFRSIRSNLVWLGLVWQDYSTILATLFGLVDSSLRHAIYYKCNAM